MEAYTFDPGFDPDRFDAHPLNPRNAQVHPDDDRAGGPCDCGGLIVDGECDTCGEPEWPACELCARNIMHTHPDPEPGVDRNLLLGWLTAPDRSID
jgi:hypothetical protein